MNKSVVAFLRRRNYTNIKPLGEGAYGIVLSAQSRIKARVAVKVIVDDYSWRVEEEAWPLLNHPNILPLMKVFVMPKLEMKLYLSPLHPDSLDRVVEREQFLADTGGLDRIRRWFREILSGLDYLHSSGYAHMDIKSDNVLITSSDSAVLCDFSGLNFTNKKIRRKCAPKEYCPPECWNGPRSKGVEGVPFDMWSFGLMALGVLTSHWPQKNIYAKRNWTWADDLWPRIASVIREPTFSSMLRTALPSVAVSKADLKSAQHFVLSFMRFSPEQRPIAVVAVSHPFLRECTNNPQEAGDAPVLTAGQSMSSARFVSEDDGKTPRSSFHLRNPSEQRGRGEKRPHSAESHSNVTDKKGKSKKGNPKLRKRKRLDSEEDIKSSRRRLKK